MGPPGGAVSAARRQRRGLGEIPDAEEPAPCCRCRPWPRPSRSAGQWDPTSRSWAHSSPAAWSTLIAGADALDQRAGRPGWASRAPAPGPRRDPPRTPPPQVGARSPSTIIASAGAPRRGRRGRPVVVTAVARLPLQRAAARLLAGNRGDAPHQLARRGSYAWHDVAPAPARRDLRGTGGGRSFEAAVETAVTAAARRPACAAVLAATRTRPSAYAAQTGERTTSAGSGSGP